MKCNMDCFHCYFPDCINDDLSEEEYQSDEVEKFIMDKPLTRIEKQRIYNRNHIRQKRSENTNHARDYYIRHREHEIQRNTQWKKDNKEYVNAYQRERYEKNKEEMCRKRREYRARVKERQAG